MRILITGGAGFIGRHLVRALQSQNHAVTVLDDLSAGLGEVPTNHKDYHFIRGSILDEPTLSAALAGQEAVVHLAALSSVPRCEQDPARANLVNFGGTASLVDLVRKYEIPKLLFASSSSVYGDPIHNAPLRESDMLSPRSIYATTKMSGERLVAAAASDKIQTASFRFFNVYGPGQQSGNDGSVIANWMEKYWMGIPIPIYGDGEQRRDFIYVTDVVNLLILALDPAQEFNGPYNVGTGSTVRLNVMAEAAFGRNYPTRHLPERPGDVRYSCADIMRTQMEFHWHARISLGRGLALTRESFHAPTAAVEIKDLADTALPRHPPKPL